MLTEQNEKEKIYARNRVRVEVVTQTVPATVSSLRSSTMCALLRSVSTKKVFGQTAAQGKTCGLFLLRLLGAYDKFVFNA